MVLILRTVLQRLAPALRGVTVRGRGLKNDLCQQRQAASFSAPQVTVVTPLLCQSKPDTQPKAWNHHGSDSRRSISAGPNSSTTAMVTAPASLVIRLKSQGGAFPECSGSWARRRFIAAL